MRINGERLQNAMSVKELAFGRSTTAKNMNHDYDRDFDPDCDPIRVIGEINRCKMLIL